jgi:hypothetical protein
LIFFSVVDGKTTKSDEVSKNITGDGTLICFGTCVFCDVFVSIRELYICHFSFKGYMNVEAKDYMNAKSGNRDD